MAPEQLNERLGAIFTANKFDPGCDCYFLKSAVLVKTHLSVKYFLICDQLEIYIVCGKEQNIPVRSENVN